MSLEDKNTSLDEIYATIDNVYAAHPEVVPVTKAQSSEAVISTPKQAKTTITLNLTKAIQQHLDDLRPTTSLTSYREIILSEEEIQALKPVPERTITELLSLTFGRGTHPYMLNGELLAYNDGTYIKIVPERDKKGYASYKFTAVNWKILNRLIEKYCELLNNTGRFEGILGYYKDAGEKYFGVEPVYNYETEEDTEDVDIADVDSIFGPNTSVATAPAKAKSKINYDDGDDDPDACTLSIINSLLKARMQSSRVYLGLKGLTVRLTAQSRNYKEDIDLLQYLRVVTSRVYRELERPYHIPFTQYFDTLRISASYLSAWVYFTEEYNAKINTTQYDSQGNVIKYEVDHIKQGITDRSNNAPDNIRIKPASYNKARTSRSISVSYQGTDYISLSDYCRLTNAGNPSNIQTIKNGTEQGKTFDYNNRTYTKIDDHSLTVIDKEVKVPVITFNNKTYATTADFAKEEKLVYKSLHNALSNARKAKESKFKFKKYTLYLDNNGNITNIE